LGFRRCRLNLEHSRSDTSPWAIAASGGGLMFYGIIAEFDPIRFSNDVTFDATCLDAARTRPPARVPDRPLSTR
jgi:hypothetical protein